MVLTSDLIVYVASYIGLFTSIFFLMTLIEKRKELKTPSLPKVLPVVSVMVPACNEEKTLTKTINSLLALDYPKNKLDIIIIDDGSTDNTLKIAKEFKKFGVRVFHKENGGKGSALNLGLTKIKGEIVGCLDADSVVMRTTLKRMIGYFYCNKDCVCVTPALKCTKPKTVWQRIQLIEFLLGVFLRKIFSMLGSIHVTPGPFTLFKKTFFDKYGPYDESTCTEDIEIALRAQYNHCVIENASDANVYAIPMPTFKTMLRQRLRWYRGFMDNVLKYRKLFGRQYGNLGLFILPASFISVALAIVLVIYSLSVLLSNLFDHLANAYSVNFEIAKLLKLNLDIFYLDQSATMFLGIAAILLGIFSVVVAKKISKDDSKLVWSYALFAVLYLPLFAFWWILAVYSKVVKGEVVWAGRTRSKEEDKYIT